MLGKGVYQFTTNDVVSNKQSISKEAKTPDDIEGVWTYIYYSYSAKIKKTCGLIKIGL